MTDKTASIPVLPVAGGALARVLLALLALVTHWLKAMARARRNRREALALACLDRRMLADIGLTRSDLRDAFSEPVWVDPTALLKERASERRNGRKAQRRELVVDNGFSRPPTGRPARQLI